MMLRAVAPPTLATSAGWLASIALVIAPRERWTSAVAAASTQIATRSGPKWVRVRRIVRVAIVSSPPWSGCQGLPGPPPTTRTEDGEIDNPGEARLAPT